MNCSRSRKVMALAAGGDLDGREEKSFAEHIAACAGCRKEFEEFRASLGLAKSLVEQEKILDWKDAEWQTVLHRATAQAPVRSRLKPLASAGLPRWAWAATAALLLVLAAAAVYRALNRPAPPKAVVAQPQAVDRLPQTKDVIPQPLQEALMAKAAPGGPAQVPVKTAAPTEPEPLVSPALPEAAKPQSVLAMTFVSQETGLTIHWYINDSFEWKENEK